MNSILDVFSDTLYSWDSGLLLFVNSHHCPTADELMFLVSDKWTWVPLYVLIFCLMIRLIGWRKALLGLSAMVICVCMTDQLSAQVLRPMIGRLRPSNVNSTLFALIHTVNDYRGGAHSFPSSHAANTCGFAILCCVIMRRQWLKWFMAGWVSLVCYSRMYLGVHYPSDILAGLLLGLACATIIVLIYHVLLRRLKTSWSPTPTTSVAWNGDSITARH